MPSIINQSDFSKFNQNSSTKPGYISTEINIARQPEGVVESNIPTSDETNKISKIKEQKSKRYPSLKLNHLPQDDGLGKTPDSDSKIKKPITPNSKLHTVYKKITAGQEEKPILRNTNPIEYGNFYQP